MRLSRLITVSLRASPRRGPSPVPRLQSRAPLPLPSARRAHCSRRPTTKHKLLNANKEAPSPAEVRARFPPLAANGVACGPQGGGSRGESLSLRVRGDGARLLRRGSTHEPGRASLRLCRRTGAPVGAATPAPIRGDSRLVPSLCHALRGCHIKNAGPIAGRTRSSECSGVLGRSRSQSARNPEGNCTRSSQHTYSPGTGKTCLMFVLEGWRVANRDWL